MGICFSKRDVLGDARPIIFAEEESLSCRIDGRGSNFEPPFYTSDSSSSDSSNSGCVSKKEISSPFPVSYSKVIHRNVDSSGRSTTTHRLIDLLEETPLVTTKRCSTGLFTLSNTSRKCTSTSIELVHDFIEDTANPKSYPRNISVDTNSSSVIYNSIAADHHISKHSQIEATLRSCSEQFKKRTEKYCEPLPPISNIDQDFNISDTKTVPDVSNDSNEGTNDSSNNNGVLGVFNDEKRVYETALKFNSLGSFGKKYSDSQILPDGPLCNLSIEDEKAFGSPFWRVHSKSSSEGREENRREYWQNLTPDEILSDSSSDLFDIDFRKEERGVL